MSEDAAKLTTKNGLELTPEYQAALVTEAEDGFDPEQLAVHEPQCDCGRPVCASLSLSEPPEHLRFTTTDRGFDHMPPIKGNHEGCQVRVYESSSASQPSLWLRAESPANLNIPEGPTVHAVVHLPVDDAWKLAEQIVRLVQNHYQGDAPHWRDGEMDPVNKALADAYGRGYYYGHRRGFEAGEMAAAKAMEDLGQLLQPKD